MILENQLPEGFKNWTHFYNSRDPKVIEHNKKITYIIQETGEPDKLYSIDVRKMLIKVAAEYKSLQLSEVELIKLAIMTQKFENKALYDKVVYLKQNR